MFETLVEWLNRGTVFFVENIVVPLLDAIFDDVELDFSLLSIKSLEALNSIANALNDYTLVVAWLVSVQRGLRGRGVKHIVVPITKGFTKARISYFFLGWYFGSCYNLFSFSSCSGVF